jgi:hypothetical protein
MFDRFSARGEADDRLTLPHRSLDESVGIGALVRHTEIGLDDRRVAPYGCVDGTTTTRPSCSTGHPANRTTTT